MASFLGNIRILLVLFVLCIYSFILSISMVRTKTYRTPQKTPTANLRPFARLSNTTCNFVFFHTFHYNS